MRLVIVVLAGMFLSPSTTLAQALSRRPPLRYDIGVGIGRLAERFCFGCAAGPRTVGPALLVRASHELGRVLEVGAELQAQTGGGRHFEGALGSIVLLSPAEYAAWLRVGAGILHQPGEGDDVSLTAQGRAAQNGSELAAGFLLGIGIDIPLGARHSLNPQISYIRHLGSQGRFDALFAGVAIRFY